jgi:hypothetical protein
LVPFGDKWLGQERLAKKSASPGCVRTLLARADLDLLVAADLLATGGFAGGEPLDFFIAHAGDDQVGAVIDKARDRNGSVLALHAKSGGIGQHDIRLALEIDQAGNRAQLPVLAVDHTLADHVTDPVRHFLTGLGLVATFTQYCQLFLLLALLAGLTRLLALLAGLTGLLTLLASLLTGLTGLLSRLLTRLLALLFGLLPGLFRLLALLTGLLALLVRLLALLTLLLFR